MSKYFVGQVIVSNYQLYKQISRESKPFPWTAVHWIIYDANGQKAYTLCML